YTLTMQTQQVADNQNHFVSAGQLASFTINIPDITAPTASLSASTITSAGGTSTTLIVTYTDNVGINVSTIDSGDLLVTGPHGFSQVAKLESIDANTNGPVRVATYTITAPGGTWDASDGGSYSVSLRTSQIADVTGNAAASNSIGNFVVNIPDTT